MKKLFLGAALAVSSLTFAQQFGAKAGVNVSSINTKADLQDEGAKKAKVGAYAGIFMNAPLAANFSIQPELLYSMEGVKYSALNTTVNENLHMINIPVMFQYNVTPEFYLEAGPQFGFVAGSNVKGANSDNSINTKDSYNTFNFSLGAGGGYYFIPNLGVTVRYMAGLTDMYKSDLVKGQSGVFQAGLAYKF